MSEVSQGGLPGAALELPPERVDGRRQRSVRTRQAIIEAYLELLREKRDLPTCEQVAEQARLSERAVFAHFADRERLAAAAFDHVLSQRRSTPAGDKITADRETRIKFQVEIRARACETWMPIWRVVSIGLYKSPEIARRIDMVRGLFRARLEEIYAVELATLKHPQRTAILSALDELTSFEGWQRMREQYGLSYDDARKSWIYAIDKLLPPTP
ncbi:MAG TPA: hypothetical protein VFB13_09435 [Reyranella sp.]|jgi:AcrR family transcriptional regulator|nr:hypothetical protein [Reyranella sp.]